MAAGCSIPSSARPGRTWASSPPLSPPRTGADGGPNGGSVYSISNTTWTNAGITWNNAPAITGTPLSSLGAVTTGKFVEFNLGSVITGNGKYTFAISKGRDDAVGYASRETTHDPVLLITP